MDCYMLFPYNLDEPLNTAESCTRKAMDPMRWSFNKIAAVEDICSIDANQSRASYYLPNIRFHGRWQELGRGDFISGTMKRHYELKGYAPLPGKCGAEDYNPFDGRPLKKENLGTEGKALEGSEGEDQSGAMAEMFDVSRQYLDKIVDFCKEKEIRLYLIRSPYAGAAVTQYNTILHYAAEHGLSYIDFNEQTAYKESGFNFARDNHDGGHVNLWGAEKISDYLGGMLVRECGLGNGSIQLAQTGEDGKAGDTGDTGEDGKAGYTGDTGETGKAAETGKDGKIRRTGEIERTEEEKKGKPKKKEQWESSRKWYSEIKLAYELASITELYQYLDQLYQLFSSDGERYVLFMAVKEDASGAWNAEITERLSRLGVKVDLTGQSGSSYCGVLSGGAAQEQTSHEAVELKGSLDSGRVTYSVKSAGANSGSDASIKIDGVESSKNVKGLNLVVYDLKLHKILDALAFDTCDPAFLAVR